MIGPDLVWINENLDKVNLQHFSGENIGIYKMNRKTQNLVKINPDEPEYWIIEVLQYKNMLAKILLFFMVLQLQKFNNRSAYITYWIGPIFRKNLTQCYGNCIFSNGSHIISAYSQSYIVLLHGGSMKAFINLKISILRPITIEYILSYLFFYIFMPVAISNMFWWFKFFKDSQSRTW